MRSVTQTKLRAGGCHELVVSTPIPSLPEEDIGLRVSAPFLFVPLSALRTTLVVQPIGDFANLRGNAATAAAATVDGELLYSRCTQAQCIERRTVELTRELRGEHHSKLRAKAEVAENAVDAVARRVRASANRTETSARRPSRAAIHPILCEFPSDSRSTDRSSDTPDQSSSHVAS